MSTGFVYDPAFLEHRTGPGHPERPERVESIVTHIQTLDWFSRLTLISAKPAKLEWVTAVHDPDHLRRVREASESGVGFLDSEDCELSQATYETALLAAGASCALAEAVASEKVRNGFAAIRPPGHHAEKNHAMGFCFFNNAAITARYLQNTHGLKKILILDWDVHHGNGTQHLFEEDPDVFYVSLHEYPFYPGTGAASEHGKGRGEGATLNIPFKLGAADFEYKHAFETQVLPAADQFKPEAIVLSAGFDAHARDPLAHILLSAGCFGWMTTEIMKVADRWANGRIISLLEGGYDLEVLPLCVEAHLSALTVC